MDGSSGFVFFRPEKATGSYRWDPCGKGKSAHAIRTVPIPAQLVNHLKNLKKERLYATYNANGKAHTPTSWRRLWDSYLMELNQKYGMLSKTSKFAPYQSPL